MNKNNRIISQEVIEQITNSVENLSLTKYDFTHNHVPEIITLELEGILDEDGYIKKITGFSIDPMQIKDKSTKNWLESLMKSIIDNSDEKTEL